MKSLIFDTGPIISLAMNNLLWLLEPLKKQFKGKFYITKEVKREIIDVPITSKKFKFEAIQVLHEINQEIIKILDIREDIKKKTHELLELANHSMKIKGNWLKLIHEAEMEVVASALVLGSSAIVIDERTTRSIVETPEKLIQILERKFHGKIQVNNENLKKFRNETKNLKFIRSIELALIAYEMGLLDKLIPNIPEPKKQLLQGLLWGIKLNGGAISREEIDSIIEVELKRK